MYCIVNNIGLVIITTGCDERFAAQRGRITFTQCCVCAVVGIFLGAQIFVRI